MSSYDNVANGFGYKKSSTKEKTYSDRDNGFGYAKKASGGQVVAPQAPTPSVASTPRPNTTRQSSNMPV